MAVNLNKGAFYCFSAGKGGDVIALAAHVLGYTGDTAQRQAAEFLTGNGSQSTVHRETRPPSSAEGSGGSRRGQGFDAEAYAKRLDPAHDNLKALDVSPETLTALKAGYASAGVMRGRLALPLHKGQEIVGYFGLAIGDAQPTLLFPTNLQPADYIFNSGNVAGGELMLLRDPLSVVRAHEAGINAVCFLTEGLTALQLESLAAVMSTAGAETIEIT